MNKNAINKVLIILQGVMLIFLAICCVYTLFNGGGSIGQQLAAAAILLAILATADYAWRGYKKNAANSFKVMVLLNALACLLCIVPHIYDQAVNSFGPVEKILPLIGFALSFGAYLILALKPDLGMKKSNALIIFVFCVFILCFIFSILYMLKPGNGSTTDIIRMMRYLCVWESAINVGICNYYKYADKKKRYSEGN